jgi:hypothetical protein
MRLTLLALATLILIAGLVVPTQAADYPEPSPYPITWELTFDYKNPMRIVVNVPGTPTPKAYWYLPYTITNDGEETQTFIPQFEMLTEDGKVHRARKDVPKQVFEAIRNRERNQLLVPPTKVGGDLRPGVDQARDSVAVWEEPNKDIGTFKIFVGGLSGEFVELKDKDTGEPLKDSKGEPLILRKTLQLTYSANGDEVYPGEDVIREGEGRIGRNPKAWVMR